LHGHDKGARRGDGRLVGPSGWDWFGPRGWAQRSLPVRRGLPGSPTGRGSRWGARGWVRPGEEAPGIVASGNEWHHHVAHRLTGLTTADSRFLALVDIDDLEARAHRLRAGQAVRSEALESAAFERKVEAG